MSSTSSPPVPAMADRAVACAERLCAADSVALASHIDADGLTAAAVAATALERAGVPFETVFSKQLDDAEIARIAAMDHDTALFTDFGSGQLDVIAEHEAREAFTPVVADHHQPADARTEYHLNPLLFGVDGAGELSGAGAAYVLARALAAVGAGPTRADGAAAEPPDVTGPEWSVPTDAPTAAGNRDLAALAVVGAVGDMQASDGGLSGANEAVVAEGVAAGVLSASTDLALYGKQTRPLPKLFEYASEVRIPGITGDENGAVSFLTGLDLDLRDDGEWRRWVDLDDDERRTVASALIRRGVASGVPADRIESLVGTTYTLPAEPPGTELRDVSEFSTLLNATARYDRADVGLAVCLGDRDGALDRARALLRTHRRNLSEGLDLLTGEGVDHADNLQHFDAGSRIRETVVGIVAGMALGTDGVDGDKPIVAFAERNDEEVKVSARGTHALVRDGLDLSAVMTEAAGAVGGDGGGHDVAAGATIPRGEQESFVAAADELIADQLG